MEAIDTICLKCIHFRPLRGGCDAFPDGIPDQIIGSNEHSKPLKDQKNNIVFTKASKEEILKKEMEAVKK